MNLSPFLLASSNSLASEDESGMPSKPVEARAHGDKPIEHITYLERMFEKEEPTLM